MKGYKAFDKNLKCRDFQYEVGGEYTFDGKPIPCRQGFHFCKSIANCYNFYPTVEDTRICRVEAIGEIVTDDEVKFCTNHIKILSEVKNPRQKSNVSQSSSGYCNTGDCNTGDWNTGNRNTGDWNTGNRNTGDWNTGDWNTGNRNTGNRNTGDWNTGNRNTGDWNTGYCNTGNRNTGDWNTGNRNTGDWNTGNRNTGDWNTGNRNTGVFNTKETSIRMFNKESDWTFQDWRDSRARFLLNNIPKNVVEWICEEYMTDEEKELNPTYKTTGGYLKVLEESETAQIWWDGLSEEDKQEIFNLPNFDADIFRECTGIEVRK